MASRWREIILVFGRLGLLGFGGPAAHMAMLEDDVVERRGWLSRERFLDLVGLSNVVPGPISTQMVLHLGFVRGGYPGLFLAGCCFIGPAVLLTLAFAWAYHRYGSVPAVQPLMMGVKAAALAVILGAVQRLSKSALKTWPMRALAVAVLLASVAGVSPLYTLLGGGLLGMVWRRGAAWRAAVAAAAAAGPPAAAGTGGVSSVLTGLAAPATLAGLFGFFAKIGAVMYGGGYILIALLQGELVAQRHWLTQQQLLDAVAVGQFTPGPFLSTATFIGYQVLGLPGAVVATVGIFLPSFVFVSLLTPVVSRLRRSVWAAAFLDAVNASAVAVMVAATIELARSSLVVWQSWVVAAAAAVAILRYRQPAGWVIVVSGVAGWVLARGG